MKISFEGFAQLTNDFYQYMNRTTIPPPDTKRLWFDKISGYQDHEILEAFGKMKDTLDSIPYNIPKAIKAAVFLVNRAKASPVNEWKNYGNCDGCEGSGGFRLLYFDKLGGRSTPIQYCSQCDNWLNYCNDPGDRISATELEASGYTFKPFNKVLIISPKKAEGEGTVKKINDLAKQTVKTMD
jgi:hypothetical protein